MLTENISAEVSPPIFYLPNILVANALCAKEVNIFHQCILIEIVLIFLLHLNLNYM